LGFEKIVTYNSLSKVRTEVSYSQNYPFVGMPTQTKSYINGSLVTKEQITYKSQKRDGVYQVYVSDKETKSYQDGNLLKSTTVSNRDIDKYGNIGTIAENIVDESTGDEFTTTTVSSYDNDESSWILSRLKRAEVTKEAYGDTQTRVSTFEYDEDTGTLIKETIEPDSDGSLSKEYKYDSHGRKIQESIISSTGENRGAKFKLELSVS
jgi:hypothetical protein